MRYPGPSRDNSITLVRNLGTREHKGKRREREEGGKETETIDRSLSQSLSFS